MVKRALVLLLVTSSGLWACVQYTPVELTAVAPHEEVRVELTDEGAVRLARHFGRITEEVTASVEPRGPDSLALIFWLGKHFPRTEFETVRETVVLDRDEVRVLRRRTLSKSRTALATIGAMAVMAVLADQFITQIGDARDPPDDPIPPYPFRLIYGSGPVRIPFR